MYDFIEIADAPEYMRDGGKWAVSPFGATTGVAFTADELHDSTIGALSIKNFGCINEAMFYRS